MPRSGESELPIPPCEVLNEILRTGETCLRDGQKKKATAGIGAVPRLGPLQSRAEGASRLVVEIGMAQGISTLSILCALSQTGGRLISVDPYVNWKSGRKRPCSPSSARATLAATRTWRR